ncbi:cell wall metabolism sensor histidine kinase WalK [Demequina sp. NBRC 110053]|uniref:sensor histidine kinase n=1 Tax=Demequina sp. NBRC 110053 TaxID=1570342 RepID=UPI001356452B|nr:HAMP domain-containing sensor histidine kinase [Demequina sp. NBRC 110053]
MTDEEGPIAHLLRTLTRPARGMTVRARVLAYLVGLTALALTVAGVTAFGIERTRIDASITEDIGLRTQAFIELAQEPDPTTGEPYASSDDLMREAMIRVVATPTESAVAHTGTIARFVPSNPNRLRLEDDAAFLATAAQNATEVVRVRSTTTDLANYRYAAVPIIEPEGDTVGVFTIAADRGAQMASLRETFTVYALVAILALALIGIVAWTTVGRMLRPITVLQERARRINEHGLAERIPVTGHDDLALLTRTVNGMLDRLERAFSDQRQLLDDASHELRTPLSIMRTNLELIEPRDPDEVMRTQRDLLEEVEMMSRLVDDLVTLAKSDRPEFVLRERVDLADLTRQTFARAQALGDRDWQLEAVGDGPVEIDAQRITQAWLQLAANAVKFSDPGTVVALGTAIEGPDVHLWVRDEGIGIAPEDQAHVLERFSRVDPEAEGAGLGLPIAAAIAAAHGGRLAIESTLGKGSAFAIIVPRKGGDP